MSPQPFEQPPGAVAALSSAGRASLPELALSPSARGEAHNFGEIASAVALGIISSSSALPALLSSTLPEQALRALTSLRSAVNELGFGCCAGKWLPPLHDGAFLIFIVPSLSALFFISPKPSDLSFVLYCNFKFL